MYTLRAIIKWGWSPILLTALAVVGHLYQWPIELLAPVLGIVLVIGLVAAVIVAKENKLELASQRLRQLTGYFTRRFTGNSSLSIFAIIGSLFNVENREVWEWARACDMSQRVFNRWCDSFISRVESDIRTRSFSLYLRTFLNELWLINNHYYEFVEQFYEIAGRIKVPPETADQYNKFVVEYNAFVQSFQDSIAELKRTAKTEIEPPGVKLAKELPEVKTAEVTPTKIKPAQPKPQKGYIL